MKPRILKSGTTEFKRFLDAIMARDFALVLAVVMMSTIFLVAGNLVADLLLYRLDPRIRVR